MTKFIFVTGGVTSSVGKGITVASLGAILKGRGLKVSVLKMDPYLNVDPGKLSPDQHGEVFVTKDGIETDLDLGNYERFIDIELTAASSITSGKIYSRLLAKEARGDFLGGTIQVVPHLVNEIKSSFYHLARESAADVIIVEVGGTVGDMEGQPFLEAIREMKKEAGRDNVCYIHVTLLPHIGPTGELKTKPTQHSVGELRRIGIQPDVIILRADRSIPDEIRDKISLFCDVEKEAVIFMPTAPSIYDVPLMLEKEGMGRLIGDILRLSMQNADVSAWEKLVHNLSSSQGTVSLALVGEYVDLPDAYYSVREALSHAAIANRVKLDIIWVSAEDLEQENGLGILRKAQGIVVPGGFSPRGVEGKIKAVAFAREHLVPYLGIDFGLHALVIEQARRALNSLEVHTAEYNADTPHPVVHSPLENGPRRLGNHSCVVAEDSVAWAAYGRREITERHCHRFEFNNHYRHSLWQNGLRFSGLSPDGELVEMVEIKDHPFMLACAFHPEFLSRPGRPHPLFDFFIKKAKEVVVQGGQRHLPWPNVND